MYKEPGSQLGFWGAEEKPVEPTRGRKPPPVVAKPRDGGNANLPPTPYRECEIIRVSKTQVWILNAPLQTQ